MSVYNITGWSGGGRRPLTYNLRAGQFRNMGGCNVFGMPTRTVINNNFGGCGYNYDCGCNSGSRVPSWMQWCMGGGMVMNFLGNMMSALFPGKESTGTDGKGATLTEGQLTDLALYKQLAKDNNCTILGPRSDGSYYFKPKGKAAIPLASLDELKNYIDENFTTEATDDVEPADTATDKLNAQLEQYKNTLKTLGFDDIIPEIKNGKIVFKYDNEEYATLEAAKEAKQNKTPNKTSVGTETGTVTQNTTVQSNGKVWYDLVPRYYKDLSSAPPAVKMAVIHKVKDATSATKYGSGYSGGQYNNSQMASEVTFPSTVEVTVNGKKYTYNFEQPSN